MNRKQTNLLSTLLGISLSLGAAVVQAGDGSAGGDFTRGAKAWSDNCARCHNMREPKEFRDAQWRVTVAHMRVRAGLTGQEARDILTFLQSSN
jgi:cytochrome c1